MTAAATTWRTLARHTRWVEGCTITETISDRPEGLPQLRRFTATIRGFRAWPIWEGQATESQAAVARVIARVRELRDRVDRGDETVFAMTPEEIRIPCNPTPTDSSR